MSTTPAALVKLKRSALLQYGLLAFPLSFAGLPLYIHAPDLYARDFGLDLGLLGLILLLVRLIDAFQDPLIGYVSDKNVNTRLGFMGIGAVCLVVGMAAVFYGPPRVIPGVIPGVIPVVIPVAAWFAIAVVVAATGYSILSINLTTIGGFWHNVPKLRTRVSAWREAFALAGLLVASILPAILLIYLPTKSSFIAFFWIFAGIMLVCFWVFTKFMKAEIQAPLQSAAKANASKNFSFWPILFGPDRLFFLVCFLAHLAAAIPGVLVLFFIKDYIGAPQLVGLFLIAYFGAGALFISFWTYVADRLGKHHAWLISMLLSIAVFVWAFLLQPNDTWAYAAICLLSGLALGADLSLPPSILADRITRQNKQDQATQFYALLAFIPKSAVAIASGVSLLILDGLGFKAGGVNSPNVLQGLIVLYALVPCLIKLISALCLGRLHKSEGALYA